MVALAAFAEQTLSEQRWPDPILYAKRSGRYRTTLRKLFKLGNPVPKTLSEQRWPELTQPPKRALRRSLAKRFLSDNPIWQERKHELISNKRRRKPKIYKASDFQWISTLLGRLSQKYRKLSDYAWFNMQVGQPVSYLHSRPKLPIRMLSE